MNIHLIEGSFRAEDALELITKMVHIKINYHENKISKNETEEDLKYRESKIKRLQKELFELRTLLDNSPEKLRLNAVIHIEK
jgi:hypothetical protein